MAAFAEQAPSRHAHYGQHWGEGAARYFSIEGDFLNEDQAVRLMPVPDSFICPIHAGIMNDPVATVDGCAYDRDSIERWFRERRQGGQSITSPVTGLDLPSATLMPLVALQRAIEAYLVHRPELKLAHMAGRSFEEAAQILQTDLFEKQAAHSSAQEEIKRLRQANKTLRRLLREAEDMLRAAGPRAVVDSAVACDAAPRLGMVADGAAPLAPAVHASSSCGGSSSSSSAPRAPSAASNAHAPAETVDLQSGLPPPGSSSPHVVTGCGPATSSTATPDAWRHSDAPDNGKPSLHTRSPRSAGSTGSGGSHLGAETGDQAIGAVPVLPASMARNSGTNTKRIKQDGVCRRDVVVISLVAAISVFAFLRWRSLETTDGQIKWSVGLDASGLVHDGGLELDRRSAWVNIVEDDPPLARGRSQAAAAASTAWSGMSVDYAKDARSVTSSEGPESLSFLTQVEKLWSGTTDERQRAALRLRNLASDNTENQVAIIQAGAIAPLVQLLKDNDADMREEAARALWNLARSGKEINGRNQFAIAQAGAVSPLIQLLDDPVPRVRVVAAAVLNDLAIDNTANQVAIARAGAIPPLIKLLKNDDAPSLVMASGLLQSLATNSGDTQVAIALAAAIPPLVELLTIGSVLAQEEAALTLGIFATCGADIQTAIVRHGAVTPLVERLKGEMMQGTAAVALRNLAAGNSANQAAIAEAGAIPHLVRLLEDGMPGVQNEAGNALMSLGKDNFDNQILIMGAEGVVHLADFRNTDTGPAAESQRPHWNSVGVTRR